MSIGQITDTRGKRSEEEAAIYKQALGGMARLYAHEYTTVLQMTRLPDDYPEQGMWVSMLPTSANKAGYEGRGWCMVEDAMARFSKDTARILDLGKLPLTHHNAVMMSESSSMIVNGATSSAVPDGATDGGDGDGGGGGGGGSPMAKAAALPKRLDRKSIIELCLQDSPRGPPKTPHAMKELLDVLAYSTKDDRPVVIALYAEAFAQHFAKVLTLDYDELGWGDEEILELVRALETKCFSSLESLRLRGNQIEDEGMQALAAAVTDGAATCAAILLDSNPGDSSMVHAALEARAWHPPSRDANGNSSPGRRRRSSVASGLSAGKGPDGSGLGVGGNGSPGAAARRRQSVPSQSPFDVSVGDASSGGHIAIKAATPDVARSPPKEPAMRVWPTSPQRVAEKGGSLANVYAGGEGFS